MPLQKASLGRLSVGGWGENIPLHGNTVGRRWWEWWVGSEYFKYSEYSEYSEYSAWEYYWEEISGVTSGFRVFRWVAKSALARPWHRGHNQDRSRNIGSSSTFPDISQHNFFLCWLEHGGNWLLCQIIALVKNWGRVLLWARRDLYLSTATPCC